MTLGISSIYALVRKRSNGKEFIRTAELFPDRLRAEWCAESEPNVRIGRFELKEMPDED